MTDLRARLPLAAVAHPASPTIRPEVVRSSRLVLGVVLAVVVTLAVADVGVAALLPSSTTHGVGVTGYEVAAAAAQASVLVALVVGLLGLRALRAASPGRARDTALHRVLVRSVRLIVPVAALVATLPVAAVTVLPADLRPAAGLLPWCATAGAGLATTAVLAVVLLALRAWFALVVGLTGAVVLLAEAVATGVELGPVLGGTAVDGLARGTALGAVGGALLTAVVSLRRRPRRTELATSARRGVVYGVVVLGTLALVRPEPLVWSVAVGLLLVGLSVPPLLAARVRSGLPAPSPRPPSVPVPDVVRLDPYATVTVGPRSAGTSSALVPGLRVLHLAGDDPTAPGAGAEAVRAAEIDRRLAASGHRITVVCRRHRAVVDRTEHFPPGQHGAGWVQWVHPGFGRGRFGRTLGYALAAGICARRSEADLVVEEFVAPFGSLAAPRWTTRPVVGVVGWFDVEPQRRGPRWAVLRWAVRSHRSLVAVSVDVAEALVAASPRAEVVVIGHGPTTPTVAPRPRGHDIVCTAPLQIVPQGLDLLLDAWARVAPDLPGRLVLTGSGPQDGALRARVHELGLDERVVLAGARCSVDTAALLASARLAVVPARYAASGAAALDALAVGTPVVAFDLATLREVVPPEAGVLVPRGEDDVTDAAAFARALWALHGDDERRARASHWGPEIARAHDWDTLAGMQADVYRAAVGTVGPRWR